MIHRPHAAIVLAVALLPALTLAAHAQTPAEQAELDADAAGVPGPAPQGTFGGLQCPPGTIPVDFYFNDFETDDGGWTGTGAAPWEWGTVTPGVQQNCDNAPNEDEPSGAFSGTEAWATNLDGCYTNSGSESLLSQTFDFSGLAAPIELSWWNWYEIFVPFDMAELIVNGGAPLFEVTTTAPTPDYIQQSVDLSAFAGNASVTIDYRLFATTVVNRAGWYIDDVRIQFCGGGDTDLEIVKVVDNSEPEPGATVIYTLTVTNLGPNDATGVVVTDTLPAGLTYISDDCGGVFVDPTLTWTIGNLANGASAMCNVTVMVDADAEGVLVNDAMVSADNADPEPANDSDDAPVTIAGESVLEIPTVGGIGLAVLAIVLALSAALLIRRRRSA